MLTDYHVHLRPDGADTPAERYFTAANAETYRAAASERGIAELGVSEHVYRFRQTLDVWQHPFWRENAVDDMDAYCEYVRGATDLRLGVEADYVPGREDRMRILLEARDWDYVIGSVHFVGDHAVDHPDWDIWATTFESPEKVWRRYFETLAEAARSGLFDIMAHPDLVKVWGGIGRTRRATCAASTSRRWRRSPRPAWPSKSRPQGCASLSASATRPRRSCRCCWRPARR